MKPIKILLLILIAGISARAQKKDMVLVGGLNMGSPTKFSWIVVKGAHGNILTIDTPASDTITIVEPLQVHFIKIGNQVYQLVPHATTIDLVQPTIRLGIDSVFFLPNRSWQNLQPITSPTNIYN